jgi:NCS1 family nucleobase:cation symporter-1
MRPCEHQGFDFGRAAAAPQLPARVVATRAGLGLSCLLVNLINRSGRPMAIESKSIDYVAEHERHGRVIDQGPFWFLGNFHFFTIAIGFVGPGAGLSFGATSLAGMFGTLFVAFHASQGPELGLPQMIQSRAQFGFRGVVLVLVGTLFTFVGFNVANTVLIAHGLNGILGWNERLVTLVSAGAGAMLAIYGYDWLHRIFRWCFLLCLPLYTALTVAIVLGRIPVSHVAGAAFTWVAFIGQFTASASYNITYAPSVSDYSRYLPRHTRPRNIIASVFAGASASAIWLIVLGAWLATRLGATDGLVALHDAGNAVVPGFGVLLSLASVATLVATMGLNAYSGMLTVITALNSLFETRPTANLRITATLALAVIWVALALLISTNAIELVFAVLTIMLYLLGPWTSINLIDYFFVRRGRYAITHFFLPQGIYGAWNSRGLTAYLVGFASTLPFVALPGIYVGPAAHVLGGIDVGWLVGLVVAGAVYAWLSRSFDGAHEAHAIAESRQMLDAILRSC